MKVNEVGHIGIAASNADHTIAFFTEKLGGTLLSKTPVPDQKLISAMVQLGNTCLEIMESTEADGVVSRFIAKRGEGIHHISLTVENIAGLIESLEKDGIHILGRQLDSDEVKFAFIPPQETGGILLELVEFCS